MQTIRPGNAALEMVLASEGAQSRNLDLSVSAAHFLTSTPAELLNDWTQGKFPARAVAALFFTCCTLPRLLHEVWPLCEKPG